MVGRILGLNKGEKYFNHLFAAETPAYQTPVIQFVTNDLQASFQYMKAMKLILKLKSKIIFNLFSET